MLHSPNFLFDDFLTIYLPPPPIKKIKRGENYIAITCIRLNELRLIRMLGGQQITLQMHLDL